MSVKSSFSFRNISTYIVEPVGEPIITQPANYSMDFSPQTSCMEEAPDDGNQYARQNKSWTEIDIPTKTSELTNDSGFIDTESDPTVASHIKSITTTDISNWNSKVGTETDPVYTSEKSTLALKTDLTKESITDLKISDSPEFADELITTLKSDADGGIIPALQATWLGATAKSVLSYLAKLVDKTYDLATRVGLLEDKYILMYVVPVNTNYINLTLDKNGNAINIAEGETFEIIIPIREWVDPLGTSRINLIFNGITSSIYRVGNIGLLTYMVTQGTSYYNSDVRVNLTLVGGNLHGHTRAYQESPKGTFVSTPQIYNCRTDGYSFSEINRIELLAVNGQEIPAGVVILLKKI